MEQKKNESFIILLVSLSCIGLTVESILLGWEFWVPPLIIIGTVFLWILNLSERTDYRIRRAYYLIYATLKVGKQQLSNCTGMQIHYHNINCAMILLQ